jgi:hypothetical protein
MFAHFLASELGEWNVDEMLENITGEQLTTWMAFYRIRQEESGMNETQRELMRQVEGMRQRRG